MASVEMEEKPRKEVPAKPAAKVVAKAVSKPATVAVPSKKPQAVVAKKEEEEPEGDQRNLFEQAKALLLGSKMNVLLICVPLAFFTTGAVQFVCSFLGLIPLAAMLGDLVEDVAKRTNDTISALLGVTFGNATELIISIMALRSANLDLVKFSLVGSVLGNSTLVLGSAIIMAGYKRKTVKFNDVATQIYTSGSSLAVFAYVFVTTLTYEEPTTDTPAQVQSATLAVSRIVSLLLILTYCGYLFFTQETHKHLFEGAAKLEDDDAEEKKKEKEDAKQKKIEDKKKSAVPSAAADTKAKKAEESDDEDKKSSGTHDDDSEESGSAESESGSGSGSDSDDDSDDEDDDEPEYSSIFAISGVAIVTVVVSLLSEFLVDSMQPAVDALHLSRAFVGVILIPIAGNVVEHGSALIVASRGRMDLAIGIALGSSLQIAMMVYPLSVLIGMFMGVPLDLGLPLFLLGALTLCSILVYMLTAQGSTTWLGGAKLIVVFSVLVAALLFAHDPVVKIAGETPSTKIPSTRAPGM